MPNTYYNNNNPGKSVKGHKNKNMNSKNKGNQGNQGKRRNNNNRHDYRDNRNIYEVCGMVQRYIGDTCHKYNIPPSELYEELHYQLPAEWVEGLRYIIRNSARIQVKREFDISSSESSLESDI